MKKKTNYVELVESPVIFYPDSHQYFLDGKELSGITSLLERQLFTNEYEGIDPEIVAKAADYGSMVHAAIEDFDANWINNGSQEVSDYISICRANDLTHEESEYIVSDNINFASSIDKVFRKSYNSFILADIKTYGSMTPSKLEKARWQLSIYALLFELQNPEAKVEALYVIHIRNKQRKDGSIDHIADLIPVSRIPSDICNDLLDCDSRGEKFVNPFAIPESVKEIESNIRSLILTKKAAEEQLDAIKTDLLAQMAALDVRCWFTNSLRITRKMPSTRTSFDLRKFKEANPDFDTEPYLKISNVAGSIQITI